jgi:hypothetical protein
MIDNGCLFWGALVIFLKGIHKSASLKPHIFGCSHCEITEDSPRREKSTDFTTYLQKLKLEKKLKRRLQKLKNEEKLKNDNI